VCLLLRGRCFFIRLSAPHLLSSSPVEREEDGEDEEEERRKWWFTGSRKRNHHLILLSLFSTVRHSLNILVVPPDGFENLRKKRRTHRTAHKEEEARPSVRKTMRLAPSNRHAIPKWGANHWSSSPFQGFARQVPSFLLFLPEKETAGKDPQESC